MSGRGLAILIVLALVLGGGALLLHQQQRGREASNVSTLGQPVLKDLKAADIAAIRIAAPGGTLSIAHKDGRWTIAERDGFPADLEKVRAFVLKAIELKVGQSEPIGAGDRARLGLNASGEGAGTRVTFEAADGKPIAALIVGHQYFKTRPEDPDTASADGRFVMRADDPKTMLIVSDPLPQVSIQTAKWIDRRGIAADAVKTLAVQLADGEHWKIARESEDAAWSLDGEIPADQQLAVTKANAASYSMSLLEIDDVLPASGGPADTGLDKPKLVTATTFDGLTYTLKIGKLIDGRYPVTVAIDGTLLKRPRAVKANESEADKAKLDKQHAERLAKHEERLAREKGLVGRVLMIAKIKLDDILQKRATFLEKKEEKKDEKK
jgi:hypothetical protein